MTAAMIFPGGHQISVTPSDVENLIRKSAMIERVRGNGSQSQYELHVGPEPVVVVANVGSESDNMLADEAAKRRS